jgi:hypothetical protein
VTDLVHRSRADDCTDERIERPPVERARDEDAADDPHAIVTIRRPNAMST